LPVDIVSIDKIEADDVIGYITKRLTNNVTIVSSDKDYLQLVNEKVTVFSPIKKIFYTPQVIKKEFGISATNFLTQKILLGDSGDNVPGVAKVGPKTAVKLVEQYGSALDIAHQLPLDGKYVYIKNLFVPKKMSNKIWWIRKVSISLLNKRDKDYESFTNKKRNTNYR
jgi:5'-3' exonuclease